MFVGLESRARGSEQQADMGMAAGTWNHSEFHTVCLDSRPPCFWLRLFTTVGDGDGMARVEKGVLDFIVTLPRPSDVSLRCPQMDLHLSDYMTWKEHQAQGAGKGFSSS